MGEARVCSICRRSDCSGAGILRGCVHPPAPETGPFDDTIKRLESSGAIHPDCDYCQKNLYPALRETGELPAGPRHTANNLCKSGRRPHCTCDGCF